MNLGHMTLEIKPKPTEIAYKVLERSGLVFARPFLWLPKVQYSTFKRVLTRMKIFGPVLLTL